MRRLVFALLLVVSACSSASTTTTTVDVAAPLDEIVLTAERFGGDFGQTVFIGSRPGDDRLFVVELGGRIWDVKQNERSVVLDITSLVTEFGEQGLLGFAFHPANPERMFIHYTDNEENSVFAEYTFPLDADIVEPGSQRVFLTIEDPASNHNGGMLAFGPDGYLYLSLGDGGGSDDEFRHGQDTFDLFGSILRIDVDGEDPYAIPPENPFADGIGGAPEVWAWGLRNPWRFSFDGDNVWIGDVGQQSYEEIDVATIGDGGVNFGWPTLEGAQCFQGTAEECANPALRAPVHDYTHDDGRCAVTGGYVYRGVDYPDLTGAYLFGDYCTGTIVGLRLAADGTVAESHTFGFTLPGLASFGVDNRGEMYATAFGQLYRIVQTEIPASGHRAAPTLR